MGMFLVSFWFSLSSIAFVNTYTLNYYSLVCWPPARLLLVTLGMQTYAGSSPVTTDDASCFDASQLSINTSAAGKYTFSKVALLTESCSSHHDIIGLVRIEDCEERRGRMHKMN